MTLSLSLSHRFDGFVLDLALDAGPGITALFGRSGAGKSTVINILKQWLHHILQQPGDNPDCPYVLVAAPTGTAAANVRGQTLHSSFGFSFGNEHFSLSDKVRDKKRTLLENLKVVIIDEISMVKSDQQFRCCFEF